jgi:hypothetical protein
VFRRTEFLLLVVALAGTIGLAAVNAGSAGRGTDRREVEIVQAAADGLAYDL